MGKFMKAVALSVALATSNCFTYDLPNPRFKHYRQGKRWFYYDYSINVNRQDVKRILDENYFPRLHKSYSQKRINVKDSSCLDVEAKSFVERSKKDRRSRLYVERNLESIMRDYEQGFVDKDPVKLAEYSIQHFWKDISTDFGNGKYTLELECLSRHKLSTTRVKVVYSMIGDSRQTLGEFVSHKGGKYLGDCDDFAIALLTSYELMRDISSKNKGKFWQSLNKGLKRRQILYVVESGHAFNIMLSYNPSFSKAKVIPIEPQKFNSSNLEQNVIVSGHNSLYHIVRSKETLGINVEIKEIFRIYNSKVSYAK
ncbi:hypothetical protein D6777_00560 [Candidatus Woesearchaeota archaeon]|nr:MAG: hypothetical protein D6777_00560 [Candidatus Woesearchaeota archaeon]